MKSLMDVCRNFGEEDCHPDISKWKLASPIDEGEEIPVTPVKRETDEICNNCISLSIRECPNCESTDIIVSSGVDFKEKGKKIEDLSFYCDNCKLNFIITRPI